MEGVNVTLQYDGADDLDSAPVDTGCLGDGDMNDHVGILLAFADLPVGYDINVYTDGTNFSTFSGSFPGGVMTGEEVFIAFEDFTAAGGSGADFTDVGALEFVFDGPAAVDLRVDLIGATTIVPEPSPDDDLRACPWRSGSRPPVWSEEGGLIQKMSAAFAVEAKKPPEGYPVRRSFFVSGGFNVAPWANVRRRTFAL